MIRSKTRCALVGAVALGFLQPAGILSQETWKTPPPSVAKVELNKPEPGQDARFDPQRVGLLSRASELVGKKIQDDFGRKLGTFEDVIVDLQSGKVLGALVDTGEGTAVVTPGAFFPVSEERIVYHAKAKELKNVPRIKMSQGKKQFDLGELTPAYRYYGETPPPPGAAATGWLATSLIDLPVSTEGNQKVGQVEDIVVDVPTGQFVYVVINPKSEDRQLLVLPPQTLKVQSGPTLVLNTNAQHVLAGPRVPTQYWTEIILPEFATRVYGHYGLLENQTGFDGGPGATTGVDSTLSPTGRSDQQIRDAVLGEIVHTTPAAMAAVNAQELNVSVKNGRVTISGTVNSQGAREELVKSANKAVGAANVIDQLKVR